MAAFAKSPLGSQWPHSLVGRDIGGSQLISKHVLPTAPSPTTTHLRDCIAICSKGNVFRSVAPSCTHRRRSRLYCLPRCTKKATPCPSGSPTRAHAGRARAAAYMAHSSGAQVPKVSECRDAKHPVARLWNYQGHQTGCVVAGGGRPRARSPTSPADRTSPDLKRDRWAEMEGSPRV